MIEQEMGDAGRFKLPGDSLGGGIRFQYGLQGMGFEKSVTDEFAVGQVTEVAHIDEKDHRILIQFPVHSLELGVRGNMTC